MVKCLSQGGNVLWLMAGMLLLLVAGVICGQCIGLAWVVWPLTGKPRLGPEGHPARVEEGLDLLQ